MATWPPVSEQEWERHKDVLQDLYCAQNLPLLNRKGNGKESGVVDLMKKRHAFIASPSQYELQFKKWGFTKNLKSGEWAALIAQYDRLRQTKRDVRITVSGSVLNKSKIDKARRRYRPQHNGTQGAICKGGSLSSSRQAHVEFLDESGEWARYSGSPVKASTALILRKSSNAPAETSLENEYPPIIPRLDMGPCVARDERPSELVLSSHDLLSPYRSFSPNIDLDELINQTFSIDNTLFPNLLPSPSNFSGFPEVSEMTDDLSEGSNTQGHITAESHHQTNVVSGTDPLARSSFEGARTLITSLVQRSRAALDDETGTLAAGEIPEVEEIMESLESLLPETETSSQECSGLTLSTEKSGPSSNLFKTLLYSFTNNFAGLSDVPRASIMQLIREQYDIRNRLFEIIKSGQPGVAKPLADNFFRAAVEGNDANAVAIIIRHTRCKPKIAIDLNEVVCNFEDEDYTPIELAAKFRNTELVRTLLSARADPNKTHRPGHVAKWKQGALGLALGHWDNGSRKPFQPSPPDDPEPVNLYLLKLLLDFGAEVRIDLAENAMRPGTGHTTVAEELMSRIPASDHQICFKSEWLLISAIHYLENNAADKIIRRLFTHCSESENCRNCALENPRLIERLLCHAARRTNVELTKFLTQHTDQLQSCLAAAIRASSDELVEFLLNQGARVDDPVESWRRCNHVHDYFQSCGQDLYDECGYDRSLDRFGGSEHDHYVITPIRTPLAEAIRSRNHYLLNTFERLGAFTRLSEKHHFNAAVLAAAEVGDTTYLKTILGYASMHNRGSNLTLTLAVAIRNNDTDAALILLDAGANLNNSGRRYGDPLLNALERCNKRVVEAMLECDPRDLDSPIHEFGKSALEVAAPWGDRRLIEDLVLFGGRINLGVKMTPLAAAVKTRNKAFVLDLLDLGADLKESTEDPEEVTPLRAAMEIGDYDMVRLLISKGASLTDNSAFFYTMSHDPAGYEFLLSEFKTQHPQGIPGFGGRLLAQAIDLGSQPLMDSLLAAGADMNSWVEMNMASTVNSTCPVRSHSYHVRRVLGFAILNHKAKNYELIHELLNRGANTEHIVHEFRRVTIFGLIVIRETPLLLAIQCKKASVVRMLLEHGADIHRPAGRGIKQTPLQAACETGSYSMVEFLLRQGAKVNDAAAERYGGTSLQMAAKSGSLKIIRLLLNNGADPFMPKSKVGGRTAFEAAAETGCIDVLCQLWNAVLPLGFSEEECQSAKELAKERGHRGCVDFIDFLISGGSSQSFLGG